MLTYINKDVKWQVDGICILKEHTYNQYSFQATELSTRIKHYQRFCNAIWFFYEAYMAWNVTYTLNTGTPPQTTGISSHVKHRRIFWKKRFKQPIVWHRLKSEKRIKHKLVTYKNHYKKKLNIRTGGHIPEHWM